MRRLVRHAVAGLGVTAVGAGLIAATWSGSSAGSVDANTVVSAPVPVTASSPATPGAEPLGRTVGAEGVSRSDQRKPLTGTSAQTTAQQRAKVLARQHQQILARSQAIKKAEAAAAKKAEQARQARIKALGYELGTTDPKSMAKQIMANKYGWGDSEFACYDNIIMRESMWDPSAENAGSGAYGIPQALPGTKMATIADDWRTNPATQIRWGLGYVKDRYGTPCSAWGFKSSHGWY